MVNHDTICVTNESSFVNNLNVFIGDVLVKFDSLADISSLDNLSLIVSSL